MKSGLLHTILKTSISLLMALIIMVGVMGLSYQAHYCHDRLSGIVFYPGLGIHQTVSCGCAEDFSKTGFHSTNSKLQLNKKSCCTNVTFFNKLSVELPVTGLKPFILVQPVAAAIIFDIFNPVTIHDDICLFNDTGMKPMPLAGRRLVLFLSQQRIPSNSFNS